MSGIGFTEVIRRSSEVDVRRARYTAYASWVLLPSTLLFPLFNSYPGILSAVMFALSLGIIVSILVCYHAGWERPRKILPVMGALMAAVAFLYWVWLAFESGSSFVWIYAFPLLAMFYLGIVWGTVMTVSVFLAALYIMTAGSAIGGYDYPDALIGRFAISFIIVSGLALGYEFWRVSLELEKEALKTERDAFRGMAHVCAWCSSVRSEDGSWQKLEHYVAAQEESDISHAICPDCANREIEAMEN